MRAAPVTYEIPLLVSAIVFAVFLVFKFRPALGHDGRTHAAALVEAKRRVEASRDDAARALSLADAADACASLGRFDSAVAFYVRAFRSDPSSRVLVERSATALARRPRSLEKLMWRHLAMKPWTGEGREAALASVRTLVQLYSRRRRTHVKREALEHLLAALDAGPG